MQKTLIIGFGEVGKGLAEVLGSKYEILKYDLKLEPDFNNLKVVEVKDLIIHICFPYGKDFDSLVKNYLIQLKPKACIIHSTVSPECKIVHEKGVVYSPVRGVHPNLADGIKKFIKIISSNDLDALSFANYHLTKCGIQTRIFSVKEAIYAKLLSTTYYGVCISFADYVKKICDEEMIDFDRVYTRWNETYNYGYCQLGKGNVVRPVLTPPKKKIGGHCQRENSKLLEKSHPSPFLDMIQDLTKTKNA